MGGAIEKATVDYFKQVAREGLESIRYFVKSSWPKKMACVSYNNIGVFDTNENFQTNDWMNTLKKALEENTMIKIQSIIGLGLPIILIKETNTITLDDSVLNIDAADYVNYNILATFFYYRSLGTALGRFLAVYYNDDYELIAQVLNQTLQKMQEKNIPLNLNSEITKSNNIQQKMKIILILRGIEDFLGEYIAKNENAIKDGFKWALGASNIYVLSDIIPRLKDICSAILLELENISDTKLADGLTLAIA
jgi:hypothetical protein